MKKDTATMALDLLRPLYIGMAMTSNPDADDRAAIINIHEAIAALEADIAQTVEPVIFTDAMVKTAYETQDEAYGYGAGAMAAMRKALATLPTLYAAPQEAAAPGLLAALLLIDSTGQFDDWHNGDGEPIGERIREAIATCKEAAAPAPFLCISPACGSQCCDCNGSISQADQLKYAKRYAFLRGQPMDLISKGGVFAGQTPENLVLNGGDLDAAIDAAMLAAPRSPT